MKSLLKWAGSKRLQRKLLASMRPPAWDGQHASYIAGFVGQFWLYRELLARGLAGRAVLVDANVDLMRTYHAVAYTPHNVHGELMKYVIEWEKSDEDTRRSWHADLVRLRNFHWDSQYLSVASNFAALTIFLNRISFSGLFRVNSDGDFNVPVNVKGSGFPTLETILEYSEILSAPECVMQYSPFEAVASFIAQPGDWVYYDPPYHGGFDAYTPQGFKEADHQQLMDDAVELDKKGAYVMITNSDTDFVRSIVPQDFCIHEIQTRQTVSAKADGRKPRGDLIITNYRTEDG